MTTSTAPAAAARVLIVDDESSSRKVLAIMLGQEGPFCKAAAGATEALEILDRSVRFSRRVGPHLSGLSLLEVFLIRNR